ncbi:MAG: ABC transporter ATP-binding protein, partial [Betaproteobacteria bacterium]|nr:ABC transporter ATP-binding protein [Betaproteobacteria bacterium]
LLVTDEILAVGDESFQKKCLRWMEDYRANGGSLLLCSHSMYHVQTLCEKAIWIHHGAAQQQGDAYAVTQAYLAHHESKSQLPAAQHVPLADPAVYPTMTDLWIADEAGVVSDVLPMGSNIVVHGIYRSPDDRPVPVMVGVVRIDLTPVFGTFSQDAGFECNRLGDRRFGFSFTLPHHALLPGRYQVRAHTLDEFGMRLIDTQVAEMTVQGKTRDHGFVRLAHTWGPGRERD